MARTLNALRQSRYLPVVVERWIPGANVRADFLGFADVLAIRRGERGVLAIQATTRGHVADRLAQARRRPELAVWLAAGCRFEVWGWHRRAKRWQVYRVSLQLEDLAGELLTGSPAG